MLLGLVVLLILERQVFLLFVFLDLLFFGEEVFLFVKVTIQLIILFFLFFNFLVSVFVAEMGSLRGLGG